MAAVYYTIICKSYDKYFKRRISMKAYFKKIAALSAAALLVLSMAACGGNDEEEPTESDTVNAVVDEATPGDTSASEDASEDASAASENGSEAASNGDTAETNGSSNTPAPNATSLSKEEAVALFNKATASAKSMKGNRYTAVDLVQIPGGDTLKGILSKSGIIPDPDEAIAITGVPNTTMQASDFSSVTAKKSGSNWVITMSVKSETAPNTPANSRAFAELPQSEIDAALGKISIEPADAVKFVYSGGKIEATVTADGKLVSATYTMKVDVSVENAKVYFLTVESAKVSVTQTDKF